VAKGPVTLLVLRREDFLEELTGHPVVRAAADETVRERLPEDGGSVPPGS
jgi:hypothetical protein